MKRPSLGNLGQCKDIFLAATTSAHGCSVLEGRGKFVLLIAMDAALVGPALGNALEAALMLTEAPLRGTSPGLLMTTSQFRTASAPFSVAIVSELSLLQEAVSTKSISAGYTECPVNTHNITSKNSSFQNLLRVWVCYVHVRSSLRQDMANPEFRKEICSLNPVGAGDLVKISTLPPLSSAYYSVYGCESGGFSKGFCYKYDRQYLLLVSQEITCQKLIVVAFCFP